MNAVLAIAQAQFRQQRKLILLPLAGGVIALTLQALGKSGPTPWVTQLVGAVVTLTLAPTVAVLLGLNLVGPELRQRRLSFYLSKPCAPWKFWAGRLAATFALLLASFIGAVLALPILIEATDVNPVSTIAGVAILSVTLILVTNALTTVLLSFTWDALVVDFVAFGLLVASVSPLYRSLLDLFANPGVALFVFPMILVSAIIALVPAGLAFLWGGRGRPRWGHRWFSWTFWPLVGLSVVGLYVWRIQEVKTPLPSVLRTDVMVRPLDGESFLIQVWGRQSRSGGFVNRSGARSYVVNVYSGAATRVSAWLAERVVSPNGEYSAWPQIRSWRARDFDFDLVVAKTAALDQPLHRIGAPCCLADLSAGGERALIRSDRRLRVVDVASGTLYPEISLTEAPGFSASRFVDDRSLEAIVWNALEFRRVTFDLTGAVLNDWRVPRPTGSSLLLHGGTGRYAIREKTRITLFDGAGKEIETIQGLGPSGYFTRTGALVVATRDVLTILPPDGGAHRSVTVATKAAPNAQETAFFGFRVVVSGQLDSGELVVRILENGGRRSILVDPETAAIRASLEGVQPLFRGFEPSGRPVVIDTILRVFQNEDGDLLYLDPGATELRLLVKSTAGDF